MTDDNLVPISVRLGEVVPPEDPEDWTRPLTWVAALGMLAGPIVALAWFVAAPPAGADRALPATYLVAAFLAAGAAATGATQLGIARAWTATLGAGLFGALVIIILGVVTAVERQVGVASPTLGHAFAAAVGGLAGAGAAAAVAAIVARLRSRIVRFAPALLVGVIAAVAAVAVLMQPPQTSNAESLEAEQCQAELAGHVVAVTYPAGWWAGNLDGEGDPCYWFGESPIDGDPMAGQILLGAAGGGPQPFHAGRDLAPGADRRRPVGRAHRGAFLGWMVPKDDSSSTTSPLARRSRLAPLSSPGPIREIPGTSRQTSERWTG